VDGGACKNNLLMQFQADRKRPAKHHYQIGP
jgi:glycerol kinase